MWSKKATEAAFVLLLSLFSLNRAGAAHMPTGSPSVTSAPAGDDLVFIHHSVGSNWLYAGLETALLVKPYIDERNDISYGTTIAPDPGRPASLGAVPGDQTNMNPGFSGSTTTSAVLRRKAVLSHNQLSCSELLPNNVWSDESGSDPFSAEQTLANYKAVYRHPTGEYT